MCCYTTQTGKCQLCLYQTIMCDTDNYYIFYNHRLVLCACCVYSTTLVRRVRTSSRVEAAPHRSAATSLSLPLFVSLLNV